MPVKEVLKFTFIFESMENFKQGFDAAELERLKANLKLSYKERFEMLTRLYKIQQTMNRASIVHKPFINK